MFWGTYCIGEHSVLEGLLYRWRFYLGAFVLGGFLILGLLVRWLLSGGLLPGTFGLEPYRRVCGGAKILSSKRIIWSTKVELLMHT